MWTLRLTCSRPAKLHNSLMQLSLDHITVADTTPAQLVQMAAATGCSGVCIFLHSMAVLPAMPDYDLVADPAARRATSAALRADGITVDLVYPFTLASRTQVPDFLPALEASAELGASLANVLCYDRDQARRTEKLSELADLAQPFGISLAIEFYPPSQVRTLVQALEEVKRAGRANIGVTLDLLHVMRGGEAAASLMLLSDERALIAQISDGPLFMADERIEWEAGVQRLLPGEGCFDVAGFARAVGRAVPLSVEVPQQSALEAGVPPLERALAAVASTRNALAGLIG